MTEPTKQLSEASTRDAIHELAEGAKLDSERSAARDVAKKAILEEAEAFRDEEADEDVIADIALDRAQDRVAQILGIEDMPSGAEISSEDAQLLCVYAVAFDIHYLIDRVSQIVEAINDKMQSFSMADALGPMMGAGLGRGLPYGQVGVDEPEPQPEGGVSWLKDVLGKDAPGVPTGRKTVVVVVEPTDGGELDAEHVQVVESMRREGWTIERANSELAKCARPAKATMHETGIG